MPVMSIGRIKTGRLLKISWLGSILVMMVTYTHVQQVSGRDRLVKAGDAIIEVRILGQGETIVMLPSLGRGAEDFEDVGRRLADAGYRVILPQPRGIGRSHGPMAGLTLHDLGTDIASVIKAVAEPPVVIAGHAFGNRVARVVATDYPELVRGVVLLAAGGRVPISPEIQRALRSSFTESLPREERLAAIKLAFFADGNDPSVWESGWHGLVAYSQGVANRVTPVDEWWAGGSVPILVVQGKQDTVAPPENAAILEHEYPQRVTVVEIPNAGHAMLPEQPDSIVKAIVNFMKRR